jgi:hypothetical protein
MTEDIEDKYPHWRDALFGEHGAVANIRCGIEYVVWHSAYALITLLGIAFVLFGLAIKAVAKLLGPISGPIERAGEGLENIVSRVANSEYVLDAAMILLALSAGVVLLFGVYIVIMMAISNPIAFAQGLAITLGIMLVWGACLELADRYGGSVKRGAFKAGEKATETPGIRRVYGKCPVSFDQSPKWFNKFFPEE